MNHKEVVIERNCFFSKVLFFLVLLMFVGFMYIESNMWIDVIYFMAVLVLFVRFLLLKLYH